MRWVYLVLLLTGACPAAWAQHLPPARPQNIFLKKYSVNDGLPDSYILRVFQDRQGFLWIGTAGGLSRYDGREFINYGYKQGLPDLRVDAICEDKNGGIWVGTRRGIVAIHGRGCIQYPFSDGHTPTFVFGIKEDSRHALWAYTDKGAYRWDGQQWLKQSLVRGMDDHSCRDVLETPQGLYINYGEELVLKKRDGKDSLIGRQPGERSWFNVVKPGAGGLFMSLPHSLIRLPATKVFATALQHKHVGAFFCDSRRRFWISTEEDGLLISAGNSLDLITDTIRTQYNLISDIIEDRQGNIWIAGFDGLVKVKDVHYTLFDQTWEDRLLTGTSPNAALSDLHRRGPLDAWTTDDQDRSWLMARERGLYLLDHRKLKKIPVPTISPNSDFHDIAFNRFDKKVYLCVDSLLLYGDREGFSIWRDTANGQPVINPWSVVALDNGCVLIWTRDNELYLLDKTKKRKKITAAFAIPPINQRVRFFITRQGKLWLLFNGGLALYHWDEHQLPIKEQQLTGRDGLPGDAVSSMAEDRDGRLWVATSAGIAVVDTSFTRDGRRVINALGREEGLAEDQWSNIGLLLDSAGRVWVRLPDRLVRLNPRQIRFDHSEIPTAIEDIATTRQLPAKSNPQTAHQTTLDDWTDSLYGYRQLPKQLRLPYYLNGLTISYRSPCFSVPANVEYSYQLKGFDNRWSEPSPNNSVTFGELPAGAYTFRVRSRLSSTDWGEQDQLSFVIAKPFWESWLFRCAVLLLLLAGIVVVFRLTLRYYRRTTRMRELELTALRAQMNPHFIYNALNSIQALVLDDNTELASQYISKFGRLLRQVLHHSDRPAIPLAEELQALEGYLQLEQLRLHIDLHYRIRPDPTIHLDTEMVPPLILQPFAENALWHGLSRKAGEKRLDILLHTQGEWLVVEIGDNGIGRVAAAMRRRHNDAPRGMEITGRRIKQSHGTVETLDLYDATGAPQGTRVIVRIRRHPT